MSYHRRLVALPLVRDLVREVCCPGSSMVRYPHFFQKPAALVIHAGSRTCIYDHLIIYILYIHTVSTCIMLHWPTNAYPSMEATSSLPMPFSLAYDDLSCELNTHTNTHTYTDTYLRRHVHIHGFTCTIWPNDERDEAFPSAQPIHPGCEHAEVSLYIYTHTQTQTHSCATS